VSIEHQAAQKRAEAEKVLQIMKWRFFLPFDILARLKNLFVRRRMIEG
jgi:hypothetical protein